MSSKWKPPIWSWLVLAAAVSIIVNYQFRSNRRIRYITGAVMRQDSDLRKEIPIAGVRITALGDVAQQECMTDSAGKFRLRLGKGVKRGQVIPLLFRHPGYKSLGINESASNRIYVVHLAPITTQEIARPEVTIANVDVRYSLRSTATVNVGSIVKTFQAVNTGNVPCHGHHPCSPDDAWKAARGSLTVDAGQGNEFQNVRVSCIAGPCAFTHIEPLHYSREGRMLTVSALDWSDTATFLLEAEVDRAVSNAAPRLSYPVTYGDALNFTLPAGAEGIYIEADVKGTPIVFPLGPDLILDWADCNARVNDDRSTSYQCAINPGYRFKQ